MQRHTLERKKSQCLHACWFYTPADLTADTREGSCFSSANYWIHTNKVDAAPFNSPVPPCNYYLALLSQPQGEDREIKPELTPHLCTVCCRFGARRQTGMSALESPTEPFMFKVIYWWQLCRIIKVINLENKNKRNKLSECIFLGSMWRWFCKSQLQRGPSTGRLSGTVGTGRWCDTQHH